ncbi:MAG: ABC transporter ATP-binding protein [bacterium]
MALKLRKTPIIETQDLKKIYCLNGKKSQESIEIRALNGVDIKIMPGEMVGIVGKSGSGKSTLMHIIGLLDRPTSGILKIDGKDVGREEPDKLAKLRNKKIGFVFQSFNLLARTSALDNVAMPLIYSGVKAKDREEKALELLEKVGLGDRVKNWPNQLSGGQQQRVAIARALANNPSLILADEPTGNLDTKSGNQIEDILKEIHREGNTVIVVTHDKTLAKKCGRVIYLKDGKVAKNV